MRKYHNETITEPRIKEVLDSITCNKCGREFTYDECELWKNGNESMEIYSFGHCGGYGSKIGDGLRWKMDLCEDCIIELMAFCKIPPTFTGEEGVYTLYYDVQKSEEEWLQKKREELSSSNAD
jgi:hypothetical protein